MIPRQGHINNVNGQQIVGRMFGVLDIIYLYRQTDSLKHEDGAQRRLFPDRTRDGEGRRCVFILF